jgi:hypothetical protein
MHIPELLDNFARIAFLRRSACGAGQDKRFILKTEGSEPVETEGNRPRACSVVGEAASCARYVEGSQGSPVVVRIK